MDKDSSAAPGTFGLLFSHKPLEQLSSITDADKRSPQPGNGIGPSASNSNKPRSNRRKPVARSPGRKPAVNLPSTLYFAHHAIDKTKYPKKVTKPLVASILPPLKKSSNFDSEDSEDSEGTMTEISDNGVGILATIEADTGNHGKPPRIEGGRPAIARKISATLDTDDEIIVRMKRERRTDKEIAETLVEAGGTKYNYKTIGSRWKRLRVALAAARDRELDLGIVEWSAQDDDALLKAIKAADEDVYRMKQNADDSKWELVATHLREIKTDAFFSRRACCERACALENGTAMLPPELDTDLAKRKAKLAAAKKYHEGKMENLAHPKGLKAMIRESINDANEGRLEFLPHASQHGRNESQEPESVNQGDTLSRVENTLYDSDRESDVGDGVDPCTTTTINPEKPIANAPPPALAPITSLSYEAQVVRASNKAPRFNTSGPLKDVNDMTRNEMRKELSARGLAHDGVKEKLRQTILAARAGAKGLKPSPRIVTPIMPRPLPYKSPLNQMPHHRPQAMSVSPTPGYEQASKKVKLMNFNTDAYADISNSNGYIGRLGPSVPGYQNQAIAGNGMPAPVSRITLPACANFIYKHGNSDSQDPYQEPVSSGRRLFLYGFHDTMTTELVNYLLPNYAVEAIYSLGSPGQFVVDCADVVNTVEAMKALNGKMYSGRYIAVRNAHEVARSFSTMQSQHASIPILPSQRETPGGESGDITASCRLRVTNVPASAGPEDLMKIITNAQRCVPIGPGSFIVEFSDAGSADATKMGLQGIYICGQPIDLEVVEEEAAANTG